MKVLVTGASGFIGSHLVDELTEKDYEVVCLVRKKSNLRWLDPDRTLLKDDKGSKIQAISQNFKGVLRGKNKKIKFVYGDVRETESLYKAVRDVDIIFHLAGVLRGSNPSEYYLTNYIGTKNLIEAVSKVNPKVKKFIYISSQSASGPSKEKTPISEESESHPVTDYGKSKLKAEQEIRNSNLPWVIIRPSPVYGPREKDIYFFFKIVSKGIKPILGNGKKYVNILYVKDLVSGIFLTLKKENSFHKTYFFNDENIYSWEDILKGIQRALRKKAITFRIPEFIARISVVFLKSIFKDSLILSSQKLKEMKEKYWLCDDKKAKRELGYRPKFSFEEGAQITANWYKKNGWL